MATRTADVRRHLRVVRDGDHGAARASAKETPRVVYVLMGSAFLLTAVGLVMVLSASSVSSYAKYGSSFWFFKRQAVYAIVGTIGFLVTSRVRYGLWQRLSVPALAVTTLLLLVVLRPGTGTVAGGSARWLVFGPVTVQPSELAKLAVVAFAATVLAKKWGVLHDDVWHLLLPLAPAVGLVCLLILMQPDLGTALIVTGTMFLLLFAAGVRLRHLVVGIAAAAGTATLFLHRYQHVRLWCFLHPWKDPTNACYQIVQSLIGLGSGGLFGVGLGASRQKWMYVPNAHTDFIFSILGEELGMIGEIFVLALFGALVFAGIRVAVRAPDVFGRLFASGIVAWLALQTLVNLGAVTGLVPVTGVPLPFVSFGGSSLVVSLAAVGILVNIGRAGREPAR